MTTLYKSEKLNKIFENVKDLEAAEAEFDAAKAEKEKKDAERKADWKKVQEAFVLAETKREEANKIYKEFLKKYQTAHRTDNIITVKEFDEATKEIENFLNTVFKTFIRF